MMVSVGPRLSPGDSANVKTGTALVAALQTVILICAGPVLVTERVVSVAFKPLRSPPLFLGSIDILEKNGARKLVIFFYSFVVEFE